MANSNEFTASIIGAGPAGLTAAIYLARAGIRAVAFRTWSALSQIAYTNDLGNYPGFERISGFDFLTRLEAHAKAAGGEIREAEVASVTPAVPGYALTFAEGAPSPHPSPGGRGSAEALEVAAVIVATGANPRKLDIPGEDALAGRGVSYCATCDGPFFKGRRVVVVGGGDTAAEEGFFLSRLAARVYLVHRRERLRAYAAVSERLLSQPNVEPVWKSVATAIVGEESVAGLKVRNVETGAERMIEADGVFVSVGRVPNTGMLSGLGVTDEHGYVITDEEMATRQPGLFAAGDCRRKSLRQVVTACGDGAVAAFSAQKYIEVLAGRAYPR